jgi:hypothetical protein
VAVFSVLIDEVFVSNLSKLFKLDLPFAAQFAQG